MKYSDVIQQEYSDKVGMVEIMGQVAQLCDHMEQIDGRYYATAMAIDVRDNKIMSDAGVQSKRWPTKENPDGDLYLFFTEAHLETATPKDDENGQTAAMIARLKTALMPLNKKPYQKAA